jgi:endonuclease YncB( thermonuclease family)
VPGNRTSISFARWRKAERLKFQADLRFLKRGGRPRYWRPLIRVGRVYVALVGLGVSAGLAIGFAFDRLEHERSREDPAQTISATVLRSASATVTVIDGDTLKLGNERIRLQGIDAPESLQRCADGWQAGVAARRGLAELVSAGAPTCEKVTTDRYGRTVAICRVNGKDIGAEMVRSGLAWAYTRYSVRYLWEEGLARLDEVGVHARTCQQPADWRALYRR